MNRDSEIKTEYEQMLGLVEKFQKRQALVVEGEWYLLEVQQGDEVAQWAELLDENKKKEAIEQGYRVTPVTIFRKE